MPSQCSSGSAGPQPPTCRCSGGAGRPAAPPRGRGELVQGSRTPPSRVFVSHHRPPRATQASLPVGNHPPGHPPALDDASRRLEAPPRPPPPGPPAPTGSATPPHRKGNDPVRPPGPGPAPLPAPFEVTEQVPDALRPPRRPRGDVETPYGDSLSLPGPGSTRSRTIGSPRNPERALHPPRVAPRSRRRSHARVTGPLTRPSHRPQHRKIRAVHPPGGSTRALQLPSPAPPPPTRSPRPTPPPTPTPTTAVRAARSTPYTARSSSKKHVF